MKSTHWKYLSIILLVLLVAETAWILNVIKIGTQLIKNEYKCSVLCEIEDYRAYWYDDYIEECYCVNRAGDYILKEVEE